ncbi:hypothetical protein F4680DRAFT_180430 [Xylaria scruposa]|nr:hypothetical protein F4680DRAFT_180430 [Xylaria scruposa]
MDRRSNSESWQRWSPPQVHHHQPPLQQPPVQQSWPAQAPVPALYQQPESPHHYSMVPQYPVHHGYVYSRYPPPHHQAHHAPPEAKHYLPEGRSMMDMAAYPGIPLTELPEPIHGLPEPLHQVQGPGPVPAHVQETHSIHIVKDQQHQGSLSPVIKVEPLTPDNAYARLYMPSNPVPIPVDNDQAAAVAASPQAPTTTSTANTAYDTHIDRLMKIIQKKADGTEGDAKPAQPAKSRGRSGNGSGAVRKRVRPDPSEFLDKPHACPRKRCAKRFAQITHLHIHERAHTGERPHQCTFAGCDKRFTQKGNLRTHERRHLGERPFKCHISGCTRAFPQKGNLAAHLETHYKRNKFRCILKACNKTFSSRGNLKTHQNNYHKDDLHQLELKFSNILSMTEMSPKDRELWDYFLTVHKNSNKGIKGRGKECRVELVNHAANALPLPPHPHQYSLQSPVELQQHASFPMSHGLPNAIGFSHYSMQRPNLGQDFLARGGHGYDVYEMDQSSISSGTTPASSPGGMYEDQHHHRSLPYHSRMY